MASARRPSVRMSAEPTWAWHRLPRGMGPTHPHLAVPAEDPAGAGAGYLDAQPVSVEGDLGLLRGLVGRVARVVRIDGDDGEGPILSGPGDRTAADADARGDRLGAGELLAGGVGLKGHDSSLECL